MRAAAFLLRHKYASLTQLFGPPKIGEVSFGLQAIQRATEPLHWLLGACPSLADYVGGRRPPERRQRAYVAYALPVGDIVRWQWVGPLRRTSSVPVYPSTFFSVGTQRVCAFPTWTISLPNWLVSSTCLGIF